MNVLSLDLSLTSTGMVCVPARWGQVWSRIAVAKAGYGLKKDASELERVGRLEEIETAVLAFAAEQQASVVVLEQYAFSAQASQARALGELGGVVRLALKRAGLEFHVIWPGTARKLLGKAPRSQVKVWAHQRLYAAGAPKTWTGDQLDAFVLGNHFLSENGGDALIIPEAAA